MMQCLIQALSKVIGVSVDQLCYDIGHDGSEIVYPEAIIPYRGFTFGEIRHWCESHGYTIKPYLRSQIDISDKRGILGGLSERGIPHAVPHPGEERLKVETYFFWVI